MWRIRSSDGERATMNKRRFQRAVLLIGFIGLLLLGGYGFWVFQAQRHQYALNRQLIVALEKNDAQKALILVNSGADPNTPRIPLPPPTPGQLWNYLLHRSPLSTNDSATAFVIACGGSFREGNSFTGMNGSEYSQLLQAMLRHGANPRVCDENNTPPLIFAAGKPDTFRILVEHGADVNARVSRRFTPLEVSIMLGSSSNVRLLLEHGANVNIYNDGGTELLHKAVRASHYIDRRIDADILSLLLAHGANPNVPGEDLTVLEYAQFFKRPDLVALLRRYGAKK